jgi:subtilisin-like proprotein convertase family protein
MFKHTIISRSITLSGSLVAITLLIGWLASLATPFTPPVHAAPYPTYSFDFDESPGTTSFGWGLCTPPACPTLGEECQYNTCGYFVAGDVVEVNSHMSYWDTTTDDTYSIAMWLRPATDSMHGDILYFLGDHYIPQNGGLGGYPAHTKIHLLDGDLALMDHYSGYIIIHDLTATWHHIIISYDYDKLKVYLNGAEVLDLGTGAQGYPISNSFSIGDDYNFNGHIDHLQIYDSPLTAEEAAEVYATAYANKPPVINVSESYSVTEGNSWSNTATNWVSDPDAGTNSIQVSLSVNYGTLSINGATPGGISMLECDFTSNCTSIKMQGPQAELRSALGHLTFTPPDEDFDLTVPVWIALDDMGNVGEGGTQYVNDSFNIAYNGINDPPSFTVADVTVKEDCGSVGPEGIASASPGPWGEATAQTLSFPISTNTNPSLFSSQPNVPTYSGNSARPVNFRPETDLFGTATITLHAEDSLGLTAAPQSFTITVLSVNDAPLFTKGADESVLEDAGPQIVPNWATDISPGPDNESEQDVSFIVTNSYNALFSEQPHIDPTGTLRYTSAPDAYGSATVTVKAHDTGGTENGGVDTSAAQTFEIVVIPVNDAPINHLPPDDLEVVQNRSVYFTGIETVSVSDVDILTGTMALTLTAEHGVLSLAQVSGLSFSSGDGIEDPLLRFTGTITDVNAALASMDFAPTPDYTGPASLTMTVDDQGFYGVGGVLDDTDTLTMVVAELNAPPTVTFPDTTISNPTNPDPITFAIGSPTDLYPSRIPVLGINGTVRKVTVTLHELSHSFPADLDVLLVAPSGTAVRLMSDVAGSMDMQDVTLTFDDGAYTTLPVSPRTVLSGSYQPTNYSIGIADSFPDPAPAGPYADSLSALVGEDPNGFWQLLVVDDFRDTDSGVLAGGWSLRIIADGLPYTSEGQDLVFSSAGDNPISVDDADAGAGPVAVTLTASAGTLSLGRTTGLNFFDGDGTADARMSFSGAIAALNAALEGLSYSAPTFTNTPAAITFVLDDQGYYGAGGARVVTETLKVFVNPVIDSAPSIAAITTNEDTQSAPISVGPGPADGDEIAAFQITAISGGQLFLADGTTPVADASFITAAQGAAGLRFTPDPDSMSAGSFQAQGTLSGDALGLGGPMSTATVTITPVNDAPTLDAIGDVVLPDTPGEQQTVNLTGISTGALNETDTLTITATSSDPSVIADPVVTYSSPDAVGQLEVTALDQVGSATVTVRVEDDGTPPGSVEQTFLVVVGRLNDLPEIDAIDDLVIDEDADATTVNLSGIGIGANDSGQSLVISAVSSDPTIVPDPVVTYASPEATGSLSLTPLPNAYGTVTITLTLLDDGHPPLRTEASFAVEVRPINDAPSFVKGLNETLDSNIGARSILLWATRIDPGPLEPDQQVSFEVTADRPELFSIQPAVDGNGTLSFTPQRNVEGVALVSVTAVDDGGLEREGVDRSATQTFRIILLKDNIPPTFSLSTTDVTVDEDFAVDQVLVVTPDPVAASEVGQVVSYRLSPTSVDFANVSINAQTGAVTISALPDGFGQQTFTLIASDGQARNHTAREDFTLTVTPVNDPPTLDALADVDLMEDNQPRTVVLTGITAGPFSEVQTLRITATSSRPDILPDPEVVYTNPDGVGSIILEPLPDQNGVVEITVRVTDDGDPALSVARNFTVRIEAVNDAPTIATPLVLYADPSINNPIRRVVIGDRDSVEEPIVVTLRVSSGTLLVNTDVRRGVTADQVTGNESAKVVLTAPVDAIGYTLADRYGLVYQPQSLFIGPDPVQILVDDQGHTGGAALTAQTQVPLNVEPLADLDMVVVMRVLPQESPGLAATGITRAYTVLVGNKGPSTATGVTLFAQVPEGSTLTRIEAEGVTCSGTVSITCEVGTLEVQKSVELTFVIGDAPVTGSVDDIQVEMLADQVDPSTLEGAELDEDEQIYLPLVRR